MGVVLKAFDSVLNRPVAIKLLEPRLASSNSARQRFAREARAAAAVRNEHVVAIHSVDEWKGLPYLVMDFIPGVTLQERIDRSAPLELNAILRIGMQTAAGLAAAHAQGLVHRDIKPANILLENCVERVKITDFGLARAVDDASLTQSGVVAGTPLFMAPEQARCEPIDHRADLFSLGAVLYAMCTGRSPFRASTTLGVLRRVCDDTPRPIREVNPEIPTWLATIIDRLLAKEPAKRFQTAGDLADVLGRHLAKRQEGVAEEPESQIPQAFSAAIEDVGPDKSTPERQSWRSLLAYALVITAGLLLVTVVTGVILLRFRSAVAQRDNSSDGMLRLIVQDSELRVLVDGGDVEVFRVLNTKEFRLKLKQGWHLVEGFKGEDRVEAFRVAIQHGKTQELTLWGDRHPLDSDGRPITGTLQVKPPDGNTPIRLPHAVKERELAAEMVEWAKANLKATEAKVAERKDRLTWTRDMLSKGYVSPKGVAEETQLLEAAKLEVNRAASELITAERNLERINRTP